MNYTALCSYIFISMITPGPNTIMSMEVGKRVGFPRVYYFIGGIEAGFLVSALACAAVTAFLLETLPNVGIYLKVLGTAYIAYLTVKIILSTGAAEKEGGHFSGKAAFASGLLLQLLNVKALLMLLTTLSGFILPVTREPAHMLVFALAMCATSAVACTLWALFGTVFRRVFAEHSRAINAAIALLMAYCAIAIWR